MRDKRPVDELSIEELERILAIRKREARMSRIRHYEETGRTVASIESAPVHQMPVEKQTVKEPEPEVAEVVAESEPVEAQPVALPRNYFEDAPTFEDELDARSRERGTQRRTQPKKNGKPVRTIVWNRLLTVVEIAAALGLIALVVGLFQVLQSTTEKTAQIQAEYDATARAQFVPPTSTPVINVEAVVLPSGHKVNIDASGDASAALNLDEVPAEYRDVYATQMTVTYVQATPSPENPVRVSIPKINVDGPVVVGDSLPALQLGVGHKIGSANPGQRGNMVFSAHNDVYGELFRHLDKLDAGDTITVSTLTREYTYVVQEKQVVSPTAVWVLESHGDQKQLTLISCYPYRVDNKRIVIFATLKA